jgi:4-hydroxybenzoate polyprenyltransferase
VLVFGRLLRLSLLPSALADILVGAVVGAGGQWPDAGAMGWLLLSSLGVYHGALALNDWADRAEDSKARPERPLPSGAVAPGIALAIGAILVLGGVLAALAVGYRAAVWMGVVAALAVAYDLFGRGPLLGPALLGACRFGNLGAGLMLFSWTSGAEVGLSTLAPAFLYGAYVFVVSRLGRLEDLEDQRPLGQRPGRFLLGAAGLLAAVPLLGLALAGATIWGAVLSVLLAGGAAWGLVGAARREEPWTRGAVGASMGLALRRLLAFTAACALLLVEVGPAPRVVAAAALLGYPLSFALRRVFPPS